MNENLLKECPVCQTEYPEGISEVPCDSCIEKVDKGEALFIVCQDCMSVGLIEGAPLQNIVKLLSLDDYINKPTGLRISGEQHGCISKEEENTE